MDQWKPGESVLITGVLISRWDKLIKDFRPQVNIALLASNIQLIHQKLIDTTSITPTFSSKEDKYIKEITYFWTHNK